MPGFNKQGPDGMGPMTGRGAGFCTGVAGGLARGRGFGGGAGGGRGRRNCFFTTGLTGWQRAAMGYTPATSAQQQIDALKGQAEYFENALDGIRKRIDDIQASGRKD